MLIEDEDRVETIDLAGAPATVPDWHEVVGLLYDNGRNSHDDVAWARMIEELVALKK